MALTEWVEHGIAPPASRFPSRAAGTLVSLAEAREGFPRLPLVNFPTVLNELRLRDHSVEPPIETTAYPVFVQSVDADGNSVGGLRHPLLDAPLATHVGWSLRAAGYGEGDLFTIQGSMIPFAATEAERQRAGDPRPSLAARYASREVWAEEVGGGREPSGRRSAAAGRGRRPSDRRGARVMGRVPGAVGASMETVGLGFYFEDLPVGRRFRTIGRTVTEADITNFVNCTGMVEVLFTNTEFLREESDIKQRLAPAALSYCFAEGLLVQATMQHTGFAFLHMEFNVEKPVFAGDTIHVECEVIEARLSRNRPGSGLVRTRNQVVKQDGTVALTYTPLRMIKCREAAAGGAKRR